MPVLGAGTTIHRLEVAPAGRLELNGATLAVRTDVLADGPVNGPGIVNDVAVLANLSEIYQGPIVGPDTLTVGLDFASTGVVELTGLSVGLWITADSSRYRVANTIYTAAGATTTVGGSLTVGNAGSLYLGDMLEVEGDATIRGSAALLSLNGQRLDVYGDPTVAASRGLQMTRPRDEVNVWGSGCSLPRRSSGFATQSSGTT